MISAYAPLRLSTFWPLQRPGSQVVEEELDQVLPLDHLPISAHEFHPVFVTLPVKLSIVFFFDEMDALLSFSPDDGTPIVVLGDFKIHPAKLHSS